MADKLMVQIRIAMHKPIPWSRPRKVDQQRWTSEITAIRRKLAHTQRLNRGFAHTAKAKEAVTGAGRNNLTSQVGILGKDLPAAGHGKQLKAIRDSEKKTARSQLPNLNGASTFHGKGEAFRNLYFPANVPTPSPSSPQDGLLPPSKRLVMRITP